MLKLHQFPSNKASINYSQYCLKLETWLRMTGIPYEVVTSVDPRTAPKKKLPFVELEGGERMGDSQLIIERLAAQHGKDLDAKLSPEERSQSRAFRRMIEEGTSYALTYFRWYEDAGFERTKVVALGGFPAPMKWFVPNIIRKDMRKTLYRQGIARHKAAEVLEMAKGDLKALSDFLGDKPYFFGPEPTVLDASAFGFLLNVVHDPMESPTMAYARTLKNLVSFCDRVRARYFS